MQADLSPIAPSHRLIGHLGRIRRRRRWVAGFLGLVLAEVCLVLLVAVTAPTTAATAIDKLSGSPWAWAAAAAALAVLLIVHTAGWCLTRRAVSDRRPSILTLSRTTVMRGEEVTMGVPNPSFRGSVGLVCTERVALPVTFMTDEGKTKDTEFRRSRRLYQQWFDLDLATEDTVSVLVPTDAPFSYSGVNVTVEWTVQTRGRHRWCRNTTELPLWVLP